MAPSCCVYKSHARLWQQQCCFSPFGFHTLEILAALAFPLVNCPVTLSQARAMFKLNTASLLWKCLSVHGCRQVVSNQITGTSVAMKNCAINNQNTISWSTLLTRDLFTVTDVSSEANDTSSSKASSLLDAAPKRTPNVFALFVKDSFQKMPSDMPFKERFTRAAEEWRSLSDDQKDEYKKKMTEVFVRYRQDMAAYLESLSPEQIAELKKLRKVYLKFNLIFRFLN